MKFSSVFNLLVLLSLALCEVPLMEAPNGYGKRVLFVQENGQIDISKDYSQFLKLLQDDLKYDVQIFNHDNKDIQIEDPQEGYLYDHIILFLSQLKTFKGSKLSSKSLMRFVDEGHNLVLATGANCSDLVALLANEIELTFDTQGNVALDHFHNGGSSDLLVVNPVSLGAPIFPKKITNPIYYKGIAHSFRKGSELHVPLLVGSNLSKKDHQPNLL